MIAAIPRPSPFTLQFEKVAHQLSLLCCKIKEVVTQILQWVAVLALEVFYFVRSRLRWTKVECIKGNPISPPILLIHGRNGCAKQWNTFRSYLLSHRQDLGDIYTIDLPAGQSIEEHARLVAQLATRILAQGYEEIDFVCHSRGGIVAAYVNEELAPQLNLRIRRIITLGSPLKGTQLAKRFQFFLSKQERRELAYGSPFLMELVQKMERNAKTLYYQVGAEKDHVVFPLEVCFLNEQQRQQTFKDVGHIGLINNLKVATHVISWLL
jgi:pimeloyl-ACP methyl ester carboxylesterase